MNPSFEKALSTQLLSLVFCFGLDTGEISKTDRLIPVATQMRGRQLLPTMLFQPWPTSPLRSLHLKVFCLAPDYRQRVALLKARVLPWRRAFLRGLDRRRPPACLADVL